MWMICLSGNNDDYIVSIKREFDEGNLEDYINQAADESVSYKSIHSFYIDFDEAM